MIFTTSMKNTITYNYKCEQQQREYKHDIYHMRFLGTWSTTSLPAVKGTTDSSDKVGPPWCLEESTLPIKNGPSPLVACPLHMMTSKSPSTSLPPKSHKYDNLEKVPQAPVPP